MPAFIDETGKRYGRLLVIERLPRDQYGYKWWCLCDCGEYCEAHGVNLRRGTKTSCGCYRIEQLRERSVTHGMSDTKEFSIWKGMLARCYNPNAPGYDNYGGRGIGVSDEWRHSFETFYADMGDMPTPKHSIERNDNNAGYSAENCRWATREEQNNNRRNNRPMTLNGKTQNQAAWVRELGISQATISGRLQKGWSDERALGTPIPKRKRDLKNEVNNVGTTDDGTNEGSERVDERRGESDGGE